MNTYIAFLRGINVGGRKVLMQDLRQVFARLGFKNTKTFIASGNVLFQTNKNNAAALTQTIEQALHAHFGFAISVMLRTDKQLQTLAPVFNGVTSAKVKRYVTFLKDAPASTLTFPYQHPDKSFTILHASAHAVCTVLMPTAHTTDLMKFLERQFGKNITTRSWNTIEKLLG